MRFRICRKEVRKINDMTSLSKFETCDQYWIQIQQKFLWFEYWKDYKEYSYASFDSPSIKYFDTMTETEQYAVSIVEHEKYLERKKRGPMVVKIIELG